MVDWLKGDTGSGIISLAIMAALYGGALLVGYTYSW